MGGVLDGLRGGCGGLASVSEIRAPKAKSANDGLSVPKKSSAERPTAKSSKVEASKSERQADVALTVRIEINLPANASRESYDDIFASIRKNLLDGTAATV